MVDDCPQRRDAITGILKDKQLTVLTAATARDAVRDSQQYIVDLIFIQLHLSDVSGFRTARMLHRRLQDDCPPIIALSSRTESFAKHLWSRWGFTATLDLPVHREPLLAAVGQYLPDSRTPQSTPARAATHMPRLSPEQAHRFVACTDEAMEMGDLDGVRAGVQQLAGQDKAVSSWVTRIVQQCDTLAIEALEESLAEIKNWNVSAAPSLLAAVQANEEA